MAGGADRAGASGNRAGDGGHQHGEGAGGQRQSCRQNAPGPEGGVLTAGGEEEGRGQGNLRAVGRHSIQSEAMGRQSTRSLGSDWKDDRVAERVETEAATESPDRWSAGI